MKFLSKEPLDIQSEFSKMHSPKAGGLVLFSGEAREFNHGKLVSYLEYEAHPFLADNVIAKILEESVEKWSLVYANAIHRVGKVMISEPAVFVLTSARHRKEAYEANMSIIYRIKTEVPIWKKEVYKDKTYEWIDQCSHSLGEFVHGKNLDSMQV